MTELMFPAGVVRIDEGHVWRQLSSWIDRGPSRNVQMRKSIAFGDYVCRLYDNGQEYLGRSNLGVADAVAQALQLAEVA